MCEEISYSVMPGGKVDNGELVLKQECRQRQLLTYDSTSFFTALILFNIRVKGMAQGQTRFLNVVIVPDNANVKFENVTSEGY